jgi:hypothetical protein
MTVIDMPGDLASCRFAPCGSTCAPKAATAVTAAVVMKTVSATPASSNPDDRILRPR